MKLKTIGAPFRAELAKNYSRLAWNILNVERIKCPSSSVPAHVTTRFANFTNGVFFDQKVLIPIGALLP